jgi:hypothetical protein
LIAATPRPRASDALCALSPIVGRDRAYAGSPSSGNQLCWSSPPRQTTWMSTRGIGAAAGAANAYRAVSGWTDSAAANAVVPWMTLRRVKPFLKGSANRTLSSPHSQPECRPSGLASCGTGPSGRYLSFVME